MVFEKIAEMIAEKVDCDVAEIKPETKFADLGIDSLDITEMLMNIEDEFGIELEIVRFNTASPPCSEISATFSPVYECGARNTVTMPSSNSPFSSNT